MSSSVSIQRVTRAVTPALTPPPPRPRPTPTLTVSLSLSPQGMHSAEATRQGHWRGRGSHTWAKCWMSNAAPVFHSRESSQDDLLWTQEHLIQSTRRMRSSGSSASPWMRWSDLAEALSNYVCSWKYRCLYQFSMNNHIFCLPRWTLNIFSISSQLFYSATSKLVLGRGGSQ